jgi:hypothetical protein
MKLFLKAPTSSAWYLYHDTDMIVTRYVGADAVSNTVAQRYIKTFYEDDDYFYEFYIAEGNDAAEQAYDHTYVSRKAKNAQFWDNPGAGWEQVMSANPNEPLVIGEGDAGYNQGHDYNDKGNIQIWMSSILGPAEGLDPADNGGYTYRCYLSANGPTIQSQYSVFFRMSNDLITWVEGNGGEPVITNLVSPVNYLIPKVVIVDDTHWYMTLSNSSGFFTGDWPLSINKSTDKGVTWTLLHSDILDGQDACQYGSSDIWFENGKWWFAMATGITGNDRGGGVIAYHGNVPHNRATRYPVGNQIKLYSITDWEDVNTLTDEGVIYTGSQKCEQGFFVWGGKRSYLGRAFFVVAAAQWKHQSVLAATVEHSENNKLLVQGAPITTTQGAVVGTDVFPKYISHFFVPTQPQLSETVANPTEYISGIDGTVNGTVTPSFLQHAITTNGYVSWAINPITDPNYFGVLLKYPSTGTSGNHGLVQIGPHTMEWIGGAAGTIRVRLVGDNDNVKMYRTAVSLSTITSLADCNQVKAFGFLWRNGTLKIVTIPETDLTLTTEYTKETDQSFTALKTSAVVELGRANGSIGLSNALNPIGPMVCYNGTDNATEANILRTDII